MGGQGGVPGQGATYGGGRRRTSRKSRMLMSGWLEGESCGRMERWMQEDRGIMGSLEAGRLVCSIVGQLTCLFICQGK